jgi:hypothetical protein
MYPVLETVGKPQSIQDFGRRTYVTEVLQQEHHKHLATHSALGALAQLLHHAGDVNHLLGAVRVVLLAPHLGRLSLSARLQLHVLDAVEVQELSHLGVVGWLLPSRVAGRAVEVVDVARGRARLQP